MKNGYDDTFEKVAAEYERYQWERVNEPSVVKRYGLEAIREIRRIEDARSKGSKK